MAVRNTAALRIPGDPLGGVLRQTARLARRSTRGGPAATQPKSVAEPVAQSPGIVASAVASLVTDSDGVAVWYYDVMTDVPVVVATATAEAPVIVTVQRADEHSATLIATGLDGVAADGVLLNIVAFVATH